MKKKRETKKTVEAASLIDDKSDWNGNLCPFRGTSEIYGMEVTDNVDDDFDDSEWLEDSKNRTGTGGDLKVPNVLSALMSAYNSDCDSDIEVDQSKTNKTDDEAPLEVKICRETDVDIIKPEKFETVLRSVENKKKRKRTRVHKKDEQSKQRKHVTELIKPTFIEMPLRKRKITLLERLLDSEIRHERNVLLQCVRFVVENGFFKDSQESVKMKCGS